jgi:hypothetical protein
MSVIPAKAGIQYPQTMIKSLDPVFQRGDDFNASMFGFSSDEKETVVYGLF